MLLYYNRVGLNFDPLGTKASGMLLPGNSQKLADDIAATTPWVIRRAPVETKHSGTEFDITLNVNASAEMTVSENC